MENEALERQVIELVATDRLHIPISSLDGKLKRAKPKLAKALELPQANFQGERVYARVKKQDLSKARGVKEGIAKFAVEFPKYGAILLGYIEEQRTLREVPHLYFGVQEGKRLAADDYLGVMQGLGFSEAGARNLYPELMDVSRKLSRKRDEERSIMLGTTLDE